MKISNKISEIKVLADRIQMLEAVKRASMNSNSNQNTIDYPYGNSDVHRDTETISEQNIDNEISLAYEKINQINEDLRRITETSGYSAAQCSIDSSSHLTSSCSLFVDNNLYPKFNYFVDTRKFN